MAKQLAELPVGAKVFYSGAKYNDSPIKWIVVERSDDYSILLSEYVLCQKIFHSDLSSGNYALSDLFKWLNTSTDNEIYNEKGFLSGFDKKITSVMIDDRDRHEDNPILTTQLVHLMRDVNVLSSSTKFSYFVNGGSVIGTDLDGNDSIYYTSYTYLSNNQLAVRCVNTNGNQKAVYANTENGVRPIIFLNGEAPVSDDVNEDGYYEIEFSSITPIITIDPEFAVQDNKVELHYSITNATSATIKFDDNAAEEVANMADGLFEISEAEFDALDYGEHTILIHAISEDLTEAEQNVKFIKANHAPTITISDDLGLKTYPFSIKYSTYDEDDDELTVKFYLDSEDNYIGDGTNDEFYIEEEIFNPLARTEHILYIKVNDGHNTTTVSTTFTKVKPNAQAKITIDPIGQVEEPFTITFTIDGTGDFYGKVYVDTTLIKQYETVQPNILYAFACPDNVFEELEAGNHTVKVQVTDDKSALIKFKKVVNGINNVPHNKAGKIGFIPRGEYNRLTTYQPLDFIYYNDATYVARQIVEGRKPTEKDGDPYWKKMLFIENAEQYLVKLDNKSLIWNDEGKIEVNKLYIPWVYTLPYYINHMLQDLDLNNYTLKETTQDKAEPYIFFTPTTKSYPGFTVETPKQIKIDEETVRTVDVKYNRNQYTLTLSNGTGATASGASGQYLYEAPVTLDATVQTGYSWNRWSYSSDENPDMTDFNSKRTTKNITFKMPNGNIRVYPEVSANTNTAYKIRYYQQNIDNDNYTLYETENKTGTTGAIISIPLDYHRYTGFNMNYSKTDGDNTIKGDGTSVMNIYFDRLLYSFTLGYASYVSTSGSTSSDYYRYGKTITLKATPNTGYNFNQWSSSNTSLQSNLTSANTSFTMPAGSIKMTPSVTSASVNYTVRHFQMDTSGNYPSNPTSTETKTALNGTTITLSNLKASYSSAQFTYAYGKVNGSTVTSTTVSSGKVIDLYYARVKYKYTLNSVTGVTYSSSTTQSGYYYWGANIILNMSLNNLTGSYFYLDTTGITLPSIGGEEVRPPSVAFAMPANNVTITPMLYYWVEYHEVVQSSRKRPGLPIGEMPTAVKEGYTFDGWYDATTGGTKYTSSSIMPTYELNLYPHYSKNATSYTVTLNENGGTFDTVIHAY